jgi:hypothetical protein
MVGCSTVAAASAEDCRTFHDECTEARNAGYRDAGICNVDDRHDPERAVGERSIGP